EGPGRSRLTQHLAVSAGKLAESGDEETADLARVRDELVAVDRVEDHRELRAAQWISEVRVEDPERLAREEVRAAEVSAELHLLRERDDVRGLGKLPVLVGPERSRGAAARLHLVDDERRAVLLQELL